MKILREQDKTFGGHSDYYLEEDIVRCNNYECFSLSYGPTFPETAHKKLAARIFDTGDGFEITLSSGDVRNDKYDTLVLDYSQASNLLALLLLTHREVGFSIVNDIEILK